MLGARIECDPWTRTHGIRFLALGRGFCRLGLTVQPHMVNSQDKSAAALNMTISLLASAPGGSGRVVEACQIKQGRRAGFYQVSVMSDEGALVAEVHCVA